MAMFNSYVSHYQRVNPPSIPAIRKYRAADASPGDLAPGLAVMHAVIHRAAVATATASVEAAEQRRPQLVLEMAESA